jgi:hypothetical protein
MLTFDEVESIISEIEYKDWDIIIYPVDETTTLIQWYFEDNDEPQYCRKWTIDHTQ